MTSWLPWRATSAKPATSACSTAMRSYTWIESNVTGRSRCNWNPAAMPTYCTALGKLLLAFAETGRQRHLLNSLAPVRYTDKTITDRKELALALEEIRDRGYAINHGEDAVGLIALAVPVRDPSGTVVAGVAAHVPEARMPLRQLIQWRHRLDEAAQAIAGVLFRS